MIEVEATTCVSKPQLQIHMFEEEEVPEYHFLSLSFQVPSVLIFSVSCMEGKGLSGEVC